MALQLRADRLAELLRQHDCLHADETPVHQLDPASGKTCHAYLSFLGRQSKPSIHDAVNSFMNAASAPGAQPRVQGVVSTCDGVIAASWRDRQMLPGLD